LTHRIRPSSLAGPRAATVAAALLLALAVGACGGSDDPGAEATASDSTSAQTQPSRPGDSGRTSAPAAEAESVSVTLSDFTISLDEDNFPAGAYELDIVNEGGSTHNVTVERDGTVTTATDGIDPGGSTTLAVTLETGEYVIYCSIANHRAMGMEITIAVT
jgi:uncharacterized cupredoxin-like copper-binding protein